jgi:hypothetical protein
MERVPIDVWLVHILPTLTPIQYVVLRRTLSLFVRHPHRFPSSADFCYEALSRVMSDHHLGTAIAMGSMMLTGGFLLSVLNGDSICSYQDLDVCVVGTTLDALVEANPVIAEWIPQEEVNLQGMYDGMTVLYYQVPHPVNRMLDLIVFSHFSLMHENVHTFDMSFCSNSLCGNRLIICDLEAVVHCSTTVHISCYLRDRVASALLEGYALPDLALKCLARIDKYRRRSYTVWVVCDHEIIPHVLAFDPEYVNEATSMWQLVCHGDAERAALRQHEASCESVAVLWCKLFTSKPNSEMPQAADDPMDRSV